jgi:hypothetical protein
MTGRDFDLAQKAIFSRGGLLDQLGFTRRPRLLLGNAALWL